MRNRNAIAGPCSIRSAGRVKPARSSFAAIGQSCHLAVDTHHTRQKRFQDRVDFEVLLRR
jgi:hypothetical protein